MAATLPADSYDDKNVRMERATPDRRPPPRRVVAPWADKLFAFATHGAAWLTLALLVGIIVSLVIGAAPAIQKFGLPFLWSAEWDPVQEKFGGLVMIYGTLMTSFIALLIAVPVSFGIALFLTELSPRWLKRPLGTAIELLAAVPSIVYGLWGLLVVRPVLQPVETFLSDTLGFVPIFARTGITGGTIFFIGIVLAIMILPIVTAISREVFAQTPLPHKEGALALGATHWEMIRTAVLPFGKPGVISAAMLALGRALGETIAVTFIVSTLARDSQWTWSLFNGGETFASRIANNAAEFDSPQKTGAFIAAGLVLFVLTFVVNAIARVVIERRKAFTE